jgi:hypothetical protein
MNDSQIDCEAAAKVDLKTDRTKGMIQLDGYKGTSLPLDRFKITKLLDDILMVQYTDTGHDNQEVMRDGIIIPLKVMQQNQAWRVGRVLLAGPLCTITKGEFVVFPNDRGLPVASMGDLKNLVFLNEARIFGVVTPNE